MNQKEHQINLLDVLCVDGPIVRYQIPSRSPSDPELDIAVVVISLVAVPSNIVDEDALVGIIGITN